jgi:hypothetical protein
MAMSVQNPAKAVAALTGFVVLGLSPSFIDWQQAPEKRTQMYMFYLGAILLIGIGIL